MARRPDQWTLINAYLHTDRTIDELADHLEVDRRTALRWLHEADIAVQHHREKPAVPCTAWLADRYQHGSIRSIADELDVPASQVRTWLREAGIRVRPSQQKLLPRPTRLWLVRAHHCDGRTLRSIADELRVAPSTVARWMHDLDVPVVDHRSARSGAASPQWLRTLVDANATRPRSRDSHSVR